VRVYSPVVATGLRLTFCLNAGHELPDRQVVGLPWVVGYSVGVTSVCWLLHNLSIRNTQCNERDGDRIKGLDRVRSNKTRRENKGEIIHRGKYDRIRDRDSSSLNVDN